MREEKRPKNIPLPPPHRRIGRAIYILADELPQWVRNLGRPAIATSSGKKRGRPTVAERIARRRSF